MKKKVISPWSKPTKYYPTEVEMLFKTKGTESLSLKMRRIKMETVPLDKNPSKVTFFSLGQPFSGMQIWTYENSQKHGIFFGVNGSFHIINSKLILKEVLISIVKSIDWMEKHGE